MPRETQLNKLKKQRRNRIDNRRRKNPLGRTVLMGIDINGEQRYIQYQAWHRNGCNLRFICRQEVKEVPHRIERIKLEKIIDEKAEDRCHQAKQQAQPEVVFFEYHDFHVFSSLLLRT
jgi:hypothetical protein